MNPVAQVCLIFGASLGGAISGDYQGTMIGLSIVSGILIFGNFISELKGL